jgi:FAD/FMN-containing dehydrogenase
MTNPEPQTSPRHRPGPISLADLRSAFTGAVIGPEDPEYDQARTVFYGGFDRRPAVIIRPANDDEVARVIGLARDTGLELAVRSGGHSNAGYSVSDGGIVLDLSAMRALDIDVGGCTAWAEAGLTAGEYTTAAGAHGLATGFGDTGSVGLGGLILGGGVGYLVRKYGLTIDNLLAADVVTADGRRLRVDADTHPDLFWAIRGGGGNFGVATRFQLRLHPVGAVYGGYLVLPATADVIHGFMAAAEAAPNELSTIANIMPAPPMPFLPAEHHGKLVVLAMLVYAGEAEAGQRAVEPFRALSVPLADLVHPMTYPEIYPPEDTSNHPLGVAHTLFLDRVDPAAAQAIVDHLGASTAMLPVTQLRPLGGAMARVPAEATAFAHRGRRIMANVAALYQSPDEAAVHTAWVNDFAAVLTQGEPAAYVNFLADEGPARVRQAYPPATWDRLAAIKQRYDPTNLFHLNQNIPPSGGSA